MITLDMVTSTIPALFYISAIAHLLLFLGSISFPLARDVVQTRLQHHHAGEEVKQSVDVLQRLLHCR